MTSHRTVVVIWSRVHNKCCIDFSPRSTAKSESKTKDEHETSSVARATREKKQNKYWNERSKKKTANERLSIDPLENGINSEFNFARFFFFFAFLRFLVSQIFFFLFFSFTVSSLCVHLLFGPTAQCDASNCATDTQKKTEQQQQQQKQRGIKCDEVKWEKKKKRIHSRQTTDGHRALLLVNSFLYNLLLLAVVHTLPFFLEFAQRVDTKAIENERTSKRKKKN